MTRLFILLLCLLCYGCSTVSHLPKGELLYMGTRPAIVEAETADAPLRAHAISEAKVAFVSPPNNALFGSSRYRTPIPLGLWAYNAFVNDSTGLRHWLFRTFATQPIYISTVNPALRADVAESTLHNYGYFDSDVGYQVDTLKGGRRAKLSYTLHLGMPWYYGKVEYRDSYPSIDSLLRATWHERLLREGEQLSYATLSGERNRLVTLLRERGYYYYRPEMISILADTSSIKGRVQLLVSPSANLPSYAIKPWHVGHTYLTLKGAPNDKSQENTLREGHISYLYQGKRLPIRKALLASRIDYHYGDLYSPTAQNGTQRELNRLGVLSAVSINYVPRDSTHTIDTLDVYIDALLEPPYELSLEANLTAKSNDQIGPGMVAALSRKNLLRLSEVMQFRLKGSYEWQTNRVLRREGMVVNSFELGADVTMSMPQLLFPRSYNRPYERPVSTTARLYADWLHRGGFFRMLAFGGNLTYAFSSSDAINHSVSPFVLTFNTLEHTTERFDSIMTANPAIGLSFRNQFVPSASYTLTYDNNATYRHPSRVTLNVASAGALASLLYATMGQALSHQGKSLLGTPYAQFIKGHIEACRYYRLAPHHTLATRLILGAIYAYGNSVVAPFSEQFHVGGASDLRAFPLRGIGPGSYHATGRYAYIDHTGDLKFEANAEWRFPLLGQLNGALFIDAGNVWLLRNDPSRPGAQFRCKSFARDIALGTGLGLRYNLSVLLLRCDVGVPLHIPYATEKRGYYNVPHFMQGLCFHIGVGYPF